MKLSPSITPVALASAVATYPAVGVVAHRAVAIPSSWVTSLMAVAELDILFRADAASNVTAAKLYEWYLRTLTFADSTFTTTFAADTLTDTAHGLYTGAGPVYLTNAGGALPAGLAVSTPYWVIKVDANTMKLAASFADALQETAVTLTDDGTGTHTMADDPTDTNDNGITKSAHAALVAELGVDSDGAIALSDVLGYRASFPHRYEVVGYSVSATLSAGNVTCEIMPRGQA